MQIVKATPEQSDAVRAVIARQMARTLSAQGVNLDDHTAVVAALLGAGHGARSIRDLRRAAVAIATRDGVKSGRITR